VVLCDIGIIIATFIIYNIVQKFGKPLVDTFVSEDKFKKFKFLHDEKKLELLIFILLMVPGTPKDVITYMTALTKIKVTKFCAIAGIARIPTITSSAFMGSSLGEGRYMITIIVFLVTAVVGVGGFFLSNYISNKKTNNADSKGEK
ncbi:MAG: VTT domain-containing protein, partial [Oscillospiraceae bacterium]|nr:VTT domain-containing protein [Oscillospiraceae bacterium]